jgi:ribonucleotide reductase beta subunit family protein with ferritin-like domain
MDLLTENPVYKPFRYPWAYDSWLTQQRVHWLPEEVPMADDVKDWQRILKPTEKNLLTQIFRFFTQADVEVANCYMQHYARVFKPTEVLMMLAAFSNMESVHIAAYSHLLDTVGMPEIEYQAFLKYKEMKDKADYLHQFSTATRYDIAKTLAAFGAFTEGMQLFASFAILLNFPRRGLMKGMGQIISWSVRDECYVDGTEILTPRGWVDFSELTDDDRVAQWDEGRVSFVKPSRRVEYDFDGEMVLFSAVKTPLNFCVTPNHDIVYIDDYHGPASRKLKAAEFNSHARRHIPVAGRKQEGRKSLSAVERVRIAFAAYGTMPDSRHNGSRWGYLRVMASFKKERKIERMHTILRDAGVSYDTSVIDFDQTMFRLNAPTDISKKLSDWVKLDEVSAEWCDQFVDELKNWDGHDRYEDGSYITFGTTDSDDRDLVQAICAISGRVCTVTTSPDPRGFKMYYRLNIRQKDRLRSGLLDKENVRYVGKVRCVTVPSGSVVVRYRGDVCVSGNSLHCLSIIKLFQTFIQENQDLWTPALRDEIAAICRAMVGHEDAFIDLAFEQGPVEGLTAAEVKGYIRYIADRRLSQLGLPVIYGIQRNPLPWIDDMLNAVEHTNFFENRSTEYSKASTIGTWEEAFS